MEKILPQRIRSVIDELFLKFESGQLQDMQEVSDKIETIASDSYNSAAKKERETLLNELGNRTDWEQWYYLKTFYKSPSVLGRADDDVTSRFIEEICKIPIPTLEVQQFTEAYVSDLIRHLRSRIILPWNAFNLAFRNVFYDAKDLGREIGLKQVLTLVQQYNDRGWKFLSRDEKHIQKHLVAMMGYAEWLRQRNKPVKFRKNGR
jgi:hypothetical protein